MSIIDYYRVLDLERDASAQDIKKAYRQLAFKYHPDQNKMDANAEEKFKELNEAYAVLGDSKKKELYDQIEYSNFWKHNSDENATSFRHRNDIKSDPAFYGRKGCHRRKKYDRGCAFRTGRSRNFIFDDKIIYKINITTDEALYGTEKVIPIEILGRVKLVKLNITSDIMNGDVINFSIADEGISIKYVYIKINII
ncbi:MAG: DnaJ domain-containing protein [Spirochaetota bacterium]|nr:DnaJ domain-containing protein [Spirochaetota bacterium]